MRPSRIAQARRGGEVVLTAGRRGTIRDPSLAISDEALISFVVRRWLDIGHVTVSFEWPARGRPAIALGSHSLFGGLALQLALTVGGGTRIYWCFGCGRLYERRRPARAPKTGQDSYCPRCQEKKTKDTR